MIRRAAKLPTGDRLSRRHQGRDNRQARALMHFMDVNINFSVWGGRGGAAVVQEASSLFQDPLVALGPQRYGPALLWEKLVLA